MSSEREHWLSSLRAFETLKTTAARPDRVQECINALIEHGKSEGWI